MEYLKGKEHIMADALSRIYNPINIPPTRDTSSPPENRYSVSAQLPFITNHVPILTPYVDIPLPTFISYATMHSQTNYRLTASNSTRRYDEDDGAYREILDINHQQDDRTRALTRQLQQAARAKGQSLATLAGAAGNRLRQATTSAAVVINASTTRVQAQQYRFVIEARKLRKLLSSNVINNKPSLRYRLPTSLQNPIPLTKQLGDDECFPGRPSPLALPSQHRYTTRLMQKLSAEDNCTDEESESGEQDMADDGEEIEMEEWAKGAAQPRSGAEMAEDISRTPPL